MPTPLRRERPWFDRLVNHCQLLAGRATSDDPSVLMVDVSGLAEQIPESISIPERIVVCRVLSQMLCRTARSAGIDKRLGVADRLLSFVAADVSASVWRAEWERVTRCCAAALDAPACVRVDTRIRRVLQMIEVRYGEPRLSLGDIARDVNLSARYLARMIKLQTGDRFLVHLHRQRVAVAQHLLIDTVLSVKEIATAVGYSPSELSRHFKATCRTTPVAYRAARASMDFRS